ncbi:MAG: amino acid racemase [Oscillospiraceae bacterium]|nr:amino acid racemase [Oscillospiraceae bacterium]
MKKTIGMIGGMGPLATCDLMKKIIENTDAGCDQAHIRLYVDNNTNIPDRTEAILHAGADPRPALIESAVKLQEMGADMLIMPCNTAHYFIEAIREVVEIPVLNMQQETAKKLREEGISCAAVLATDGTVQSGLYDRALKEAGITPVYPDENQQKLVMSVIYDYVKAGKTYTAVENIHSMVTHLQEKGAQGLILGCTELPIAFASWETAIPTFDPTLILARVAVQQAGYPVK